VRHQVTQQIEFLRCKVHLSVPNLYPPGTEVDFYMIECDGAGTTFRRIWEMGEVRAVYLVFKWQNQLNSSDGPGFPFPLWGWYLKSTAPSNALCPLPLRSHSPCGQHRHR
jgi:hypothetical protein